MSSDRMSKEKDWNDMDSSERPVVTEANKSYAGKWVTE